MREEYPFPCTEKIPVYIQLHIGIFNFDNLSVHGLMTIQNRTTDLLVHIIYNIDIKHNSCSEFLCVIVIIIPSSPFSFKRYLLEYVRNVYFMTKSVIDHVAIVLL